MLAGNAVLIYKFSSYSMFPVIVLIRDIERNLREREKHCQSQLFTNVYQCVIYYEKERLRKKVMFLSSIYTLSN